MSERHIFPTIDSDFNTYVIGAIPFLDSNAVALSVSGPNIILVDGQLVSWKANWAKHVDPAQNTSIVNRAKDTLRGQIETSLRSIYDDIPESALDDTARATLHLAARDNTRTATAGMGVPPVQTLKTAIHLAHELQYQNPETPDSKAMPHGQQILQERFVGAAGLADTAITFGNAQIITRAKSTVIFDYSQVGQTCYYRSCYINAHHERSPYSVTLSVLVN
jgi:hypothetical protein